MAERIAIHQADRPASWDTIETFDLTAAIHEAPVRSTVIIDALDTWLVQAMTDADLWTDADVAPWGSSGQAAAQDIIAQAVDIARAAHDDDRHTVVIAGQPGTGVHAVGAGARRYVDLHGRVLQALAARADRTVLMVSGLPLELPPPTTIDGN
jgi:adenosyl cobinamide kinase/adenosyl cobinamide phosphate guanylyltransferase